jgi:hypothetical protein
MELPLRGSGNIGGFLYYNALDTIAEDINPIITIFLGNVCKAVPATSAIITLPIGFYYEKEKSFIIILEILFIISCVLCSMVVYEISLQGIFTKPYVSSVADPGCFIPDADP